MAMPTSDLVIDVGNTHIKVALFVGDSLDGVLRIHGRSAAELKKLVKKSGAKRAIISSVAAPAPQLEEALAGRLELLVMTPATAVPVPNAYATPHTLGTDRLANACAAFAKYPGQHVLIIDFGTCVKYDLVHPVRGFLGGAIAPGLKMRFAAMHTMTGKLPFIEHWEAQDARWPGNSTHSSMVSGVVMGIQAEMAQYINSATDHCEDLVVVATGGDYAFFEKAFKNIIFAHPYLTLEGLHEILRFNLA
jgi:type III pantothenate kinase